MSENRYHYTYRVEWSPEDEEWVCASSSRRCHGLTPTRLRLSAASSSSSPISV